MPNHSMMPESGEHPEADTCEASVAFSVPTVSRIPASTGADMISSPSTLSSSAAENASSCEGSHNPIRSSQFLQDDEPDTDDNSEVEIIRNSQVELITTRPSTHHHPIISRDGGEVPIRSK